MQLVREKVYAMEQTHMALKQKYADLPLKPNRICRQSLTESSWQVRRRGHSSASPTRTVQRWRSSGRHGRSPSACRSSTSPPSTSHWYGDQCFQRHHVRSKWTGWSYPTPSPASPGAAATTSPDAAASSGTPGPSASSAIPGAALPAVPSGTSSWLPLAATAEQC